MGDSFAQAHWNLSSSSSDQAGSFEAARWTGRRRRLVAGGVECMLAFGWAFVCLPAQVGSMVLKFEAACAFANVF